MMLRHPGGAVACSPSIERLMFHMRRLCKSTPGRRVKIGGHFLRADMPWLVNEGLDVRDEYFPDPADPRAGGWDTSLEHHSINETARLKLEEVAMKLTTCPRYDTALSEWKKRFCSVNHLKFEDVEGYGESPAM